MQILDFPRVCANPLPGQYRNISRALPADMKFMPLTMNMMMKTALEDTVSQTMNSKALLKKVEKLDKFSRQSCSNGGGQRPRRQGGE